MSETKFPLTYNAVDNAQDDIPTTLSYSEMIGLAVALFDHAAIPAREWTTLCKIAEIMLEREKGG